MIEIGPSRRVLPSVLTAVFVAILSAEPAGAQGGPPARDPRSPGGLWGVAGPDIERLRFDETKLKLVLPETPQQGFYTQRVEGVPGPNGEYVVIDKNGVTLTFPEQDVKLNIGGRLHIEYGASGLSRRELPEPFFGNIGIRFAWLQNDLSIGKDWKVRFWYDLGAPSAPIQDAFVAYQGIENVAFTIGNMKFPLSFEWLEDNNDLLFAQRSIIQGFVPNPAREFGFVGGYAGKDWTVLGGVFGGPPSGPNLSDGVASDGVAGVFRATYAPILTEKEVLHFGIAANTRFRTRGEGDFRISRIDDAFLFAKPFADTGNIPDVSTVTRIGAEFGYRNGPLLVQAEYIHVNLGRFAGGGPSLNFQGGYVAASYILNGDNRVYHLAPYFGGPSYGLFWEVPMADYQHVSRGGIGVWEVAARFDAIDLDDRGRSGGRDQNVTLGINWYPEANVKIVSNYIYGRVSPGAYQLAATGTQRFTANTFLGKLQFYW